MSLPPLKNTNTFSSCSLDHTHNAMWNCPQILQKSTINCSLSNYFPTGTWYSDCWQNAKKCITGRDVAFLVVTTMQHFLMFSQCRSEAELPMLQCTAQCSRTIPAAKGSLCNAAWGSTESLLSPGMLLAVGRHCSVSCSRYTLAASWTALHIKQKILLHGPQTKASCLLSRDVKTI